MYLVVSVHGARLSKILLSSPSSIPSVCLAADLRYCFRTSEISEIGIVPIHRDPSPEATCGAAPEANDFVAQNHNACRTAASRCQWPLTTCTRTRSGGGTAVFSGGTARRCRSEIARCADPPHPLRPGPHRLPLRRGARCMMARSVSRVSRGTQRGRRDAELTARVAFVAVGPSPAPI
jgi:hypothetical protein